MRDIMKCNSFSISKISKIVKDNDISMEVLNEKDTGIS
jgi:hypothetical protein